jgi:hypothetical protein
MSEENKSAIVDNSETSEKSFNPIAFGDNFVSEEATDTEAVGSENTEEAKATEESEDDWTFEEKETVEESKPGEDTARDDVNWGAIAAQLGLDGKSTKEEIQAALKNAEDSKEEEKAVASGNEFDQFESILKLDDRGIMVEELKARGFGEGEIEDYIDRLEDAGTLKYEALKIRNDVRKHIVEKESQAKAQLKLDEEEKAKKVEENKIQLQKTIKDREDFYGYNLGKEQKKEVYKYITSGDFYKDLSSSHEEVFEQAMFKLFKERVMSLQSKKGYEDGKSQILDNITSPDLGRTSKPRPVSSKAFDPSQFSRK